MHMLPRHRAAKSKSIVFCGGYFPALMHSPPPPHPTRPHALAEEAHTMVCATSLGDNTQRAASLTVIGHQTKTQRWRDACYDINTNESKTAKVVGSD